MDTQKYKSVPVAGRNARVLAGDLVRAARYPNKMGFASRVE